MRNIDFYIKCFKNLRRAKTEYGYAPHKPVLLLSIIEGYAQEYISGQRIYITPELIAFFRGALEKPGKDAAYL